MLTVLADIFVPAFGPANTLSPGLINDARIIRSVLGESAVKIRTVPGQCYEQPKVQNDRALGLMKTSDTAIFLEHIYESSELLSYDRRIFIANPEWLLPSDEHRVLAGFVTEFWHKTRSGMELLSAKFPNHVHTYIGFTSLDHSPASIAPDYSAMGHFCGKAMGRRHTQELLNIWAENPQLPQLTVHFHDHRIPDVAGWLQNGNIRLKLGMMLEEDFRQEFAMHGIQLCTSSTEGFGHHINEARAVGALVVTLDAPPMNELIDATSGVLVPYTEASAHHNGFFYKSTQDQLLEAIIKVIGMPTEERASLGKSARQRFVEERKTFSAALRGQFGL